MHLTKSHLALTASQPHDMSSFQLAFSLLLLDTKEPLTQLPSPKNIIYIHIRARECEKKREGVSKKELENEMVGAKSSSAFQRMAYIARGRLKMTDAKHGLR